MQYSVDLALTGAVRGTYAKNIFQELGLESSQDWHRYKRLYISNKISKNKNLCYISKLIPTRTYHILSEK